MSIAGDAVKRSSAMPKSSVVALASIPSIRRPRVVVSHSGKQHAYRLARAVQQAGSLQAFVTSGYYKPRQFPDRLARSVPKLDTFLRRRNLSKLDPHLVCRNWRFEVPELIARRFGVSDERWIFRRDASFDHWMARRLTNDAFDVDLFWGFQGSCLESLWAGRERGKTTLAEFAAPHVTTAIRLLREEAEKHPEWADSIANFRFPDWYRERLEQEPHAAEYCIAPSRFVMRSLQEVGIPDERLRLLPLGADIADFAPSDRPSGGPFRILFVGKIGQHKGIKYLLDAYRKMRSSSTELLLLGPIMGSGRGLANYRGHYEWLGSKEHSEVAEEMRRCHVLVLPSVLDGCPLVIPEAMMTGMPVIASTHGSAPEFIEDGKSGFVIDPYDVESLADRLERLASNRSLAAAMGREAAKAAALFSWDVHAERVAEILSEFMK
jgi:glycosyltransferase involved in cell wall biosynthesis